MKSAQRPTAAALRELPSRLSHEVLGRAHSGLQALRQRARPANAGPSRGVAFVGTVWTGGDSSPAAGIVVLDGAGKIAAFLPPGSSLPADLLVLGGPQYWVVPGVTDAHVHLGFDPGLQAARPTVTGLESGLTAVRDLGAPLPLARRWRSGHRRPAAGSPFVASSGPILTAPGGYPSRSWGSGGYALFCDYPAQARAAVQRLAAEGVDLIKIAFEPGPVGWPVLAPKVAQAIVQASHSAGLAVVAHALSCAMVTRALDVGVDELAHTPTERLDELLVNRIASSRVSVTSTLQTFFSDGDGRIAAANAADLVTAGVRLHYGTDQGNAGTRPGVDPRELDRLADTGLGRLGALRAATEFSSTAPGMRGRSGRLTVGEAAVLVLLPFSPLAEPGVWRIPSAVYADGRLTVSTVKPAGDANDLSSSGVDAIR